jgi:hypothetical protein
LNLTVERGDGFINEIPAPTAERIQSCEHVRVQPGNKLQYLRFDVIHIGADGKLDSVVFHGTLFEFIKGALDIRAVIVLALIFADCKSACLDEHAILDHGQISFKLPQL